MAKEILEINIKSAIDDLVKLVDIECINKIHPGFIFIISDTNEFKESSFFDDRKIRNKINRKKIPKPFEDIIKILEQDYFDLYDVNLYIFKAAKKYTIIEIRYFRKSNFDKDYFEIIKDNAPMFHSKIAQPPFKKPNAKFDVNWKSKNILNYFRLLFHRFKYRK